MRKSPFESWLSFIGRVIADLFRDKEDWHYWTNVFATAGAACLAVAFIEGNSIALIAGVFFCLYGLKVNRRQ
jgi:ABC-type transporter Mla maintaining outer membrane lipid asymmetry permease subunit MlaE